MLKMLKISCYYDNVWCVCHNFSYADGISRANSGLATALSNVKGFGFCFLKFCGILLLVEIWSLNFLDPLCHHSSHHPPQ